MRAIWTGAITFGLVNVPVKVYSATEDHDVPLHQVHDEDGGRIRYQRRCEIDGKVIPYEHIAKAYDDGERTDHLFGAIHQRSGLGGDREIRLYRHGFAATPLDFSYDFLRLGMRHDVGDPRLRDRQLQQRVHGLAGIAAPPQ